MTRLPALLFLLCVPGLIGAAPGGGCEGQEGYLQCGGGVGGCYPASQHCDGTQHCSNGWDERDCPDPAEDQVTLADTLTQLHASHASTKSVLVVQLGYTASPSQSASNYTPSTTGHKLHLKSTTSASDSKEDTGHLPIDVSPRESRANLGWLITPVIFGVACLYVLYRCISDGLCRCRRFRRFSGGSDSFSHLNGLSFYSLHFPQSRITLNPDASQTQLTSGQVDGEAGTVPLAETTSHPLLNGFVRVPLEEPAEQNCTSIANISNSLAQQSQGDANHANGDIASGHKKEQASVTDC